MTRPASQTVRGDVEFDMRGTQYNDDGEYVDQVELNEFTLLGKSWDVAKITEALRKRGLAAPETRAMIIWNFMQSIGDDATNADEWEAE